MQIHNSFNKEIRFDTLFSMQNMETFFLQINMFFGRSLSYF